MADPNTRTGKRAPVTLKIKFKSETIEQFIERYAVDVSQGGIFIRTKEPLAVGTQMKFEFQLRDASPLIAGEGTVVWTRENDPSRPAIAPGMGVRFDRLAEGSPTVLERILAEKLKQTPARNSHETTKPPVFRDEPTRVAPAPVQDMLNAATSDAQRDAQGKAKARGAATPWQSDADEFPEEAFEEQTKVRSLDELVAQTAQKNDTPDPSRELFGSHAPGGAMATTIIPPDELAMRRQQARNDSTVQDGATQPLLEPPPQPEARPIADRADRDSAPNLPNPPSAPSQLPTLPPNPSAGREPRLLDTTPSPRAESGLVADSAMAKTRLGLEPAKVDTKPGVGAVAAATAPVSPAAPPAAVVSAAKVAAEAKAKPVAASESPATSGSRRPLSEPMMPLKKPSILPIVVLVIAFVAAAAAAVWFFILKDTVDDDLGKVATHPTQQIVKQPVTPVTPEQPTVPPGSAAAIVGSAGSAAPQLATGSNTGSAAATPAVKLVDTAITAPGADKATVTIDGTGYNGPLPVTAKLEPGKVYKAHVSAPGFLTLDLDVKGGQAAAARLAAKPKLLTVTSEPPGAQIVIDGVAMGHVTPYDVDIKQFGSKAKLRVSLRKAGFKPNEMVVDVSTPADDGTKLTIAAPAASLTVAPVQAYVPPPHPVGHGSDSTATPAVGSGGTATPTPPPPTPGSAAPSPDTSAKPATPPPTPTGGEPEPDFAK